METSMNNNSNTILNKKSESESETENLIRGNELNKQTKEESFISHIISSRGSLDQKNLHRVVLTGGPCSGKSTCLNKIKNFFQNIGWKVFTVPETATILISTGIQFYDLFGEYKVRFQENLLKNLLQIEDSINEVAKFYQSEKDQNCIIIYDRGAMDPVSYLEPQEWEILKSRNPNWNEVDLRDNRYDQVIHLITAAKGAQEFYTLENNTARTETIGMACELDEKCAKSWVGHPCLDIIDNAHEFEEKVAETLKAVCQRIGLKLEGFGGNNKKRKFLVSLPLSDESKFPKCKEIKVIINYLLSSQEFGQIRIRKNGDGDNWSYSYSVRIKKEGQLVETRNQITKREYAILTKAIDKNHFTVIIKRLCFIWNNRYYRLDVFQQPSVGICSGLVLLSTRLSKNDETLPDFLKIEKEVTDDPEYYLRNLSRKNL